MQCLNINIKAFFKFSKVNLFAQKVEIRFKTLSIKVKPDMRINRRLAKYILDICRYMTLNEVAKHLGRDCKTIKKIHNVYIKERFFVMK